jgi:uncharacterized protein (TIGR02646 family)
MSDALTLVDAERVFGKAVLASIEARRFYREWRRKATGTPGSWSLIRDATYSVGGKKVKGSFLVTLLRKHLVTLQGGRCCYCRCRLQGIGYARPIEHVLSRDDYPQYTFRYRNLAVSCYDCNHLKSASNWSSVKKTRRRYPNERACADFFHPRYHAYDEHVKFVHIATNGAEIRLFIGISAQGKQLCRDLLHRACARELSLSANARLAGPIEQLRRHIDEESAHARASVETFLKVLESAALPIA